MHFRSVYARFIVILACAVPLTACNTPRAQALIHNATATSEPTPAATLTATPPPEPAIAPLEWKTGVNPYTIEVDATPRRFLVYIPASYDASQPTPVVFMFHGSNQSGKIMYERTGWAAKADQEGFIVVYPTSWKYRLLEDNQMADKWNSPKMADLVVAGTELKDDVKFVRVLIETIEATFNVDQSRLFASGFSNGGGFVLTSLLPQMHDTFAAFSTSGSGMAGEAAPENLPTGLDASVYSIIGSQDEKLSDGSGHPLPFPMIAEDMMSDEMLGQMFTTTTTVLSLSTEYEVVYDQPSFATMTFRHSLTGNSNRYVFRMVNNMGHVYPSGDNNRAGFDAADLFWDFFMEETAS